MSGIQGIPPTSIYRAKENQEIPYCVISRISDNKLRNKDRFVKIKQARIQVTVVHSTQALLNDATNAIEGRLDGVTDAIIFGNEIEYIYLISETPGYDFENDVFFCQMDFDIKLKA